MKRRRKTKRSKIRKEDDRVEPNEDIAIKIPEVIKREDFARENGINRSNKERARGPSNFI